MHIDQPKTGYRINQDSFLLAEFVTCKPSDRIIDLGTGVGIIPILLAQRKKFKEIIGIELQPEYVSFAEQNIRANELQDKMKIIQADIRNISQLFPANSFDIVVSNPPYITLGKGRLSPNPAKRFAKQELTCSLADIIAAARYLLKNKGKLYLSYPSSNLLNLLFLLREANLEPKRLGISFSEKKTQSNLVLIEASKGVNPGLIIETI
ncbi:MAG: methyltransferase [bacterium]|nr:methyltransferase [bacterium]